MSVTITEKSWLLHSYSKMENGVWRHVNIDKRDNHLKIMFHPHPWLVIKLDSDLNLDLIDLSGRSGEKFEAHYTGSTISIVITDPEDNDNNVLAKIRFRFAKGKYGAKTAENSCSEVAEELQKFFKVIQHHTDMKPICPKKVVDSDPITVEDIGKEFVDMLYNPSMWAELNLPEGIKEAVIDTFLIHPKFSDLVTGIWDISCRRRQDQGGPMFVPQDFQPIAEQIAKHLMHD